MLTEQTPSGAPVFTLSLPRQWISYRFVPIAPGQLDVADLRRGMDTMARKMFHPVVPARVFDTRSGSGLRVVERRKVAGGSELVVRLTDLVGRVPAQGVGAVALNVTVTGPEADGWLSVVPCGGSGGTSSVNYRVGETVANLVVTPVSAAGTACFFTTASADVIADVSGWFGVG